MFEEWQNDAARVLRRERRDRSNRLQSSKIDFEALRQQIVTEEAAVAALDKAIDIIEQPVETPES